VVIDTIYTGPDCGPLSGGNLTDQRQLVWLSWANPGE